MLWNTFELLATTFEAVIKIYFFTKFFEFKGNKNELRVVFIVVCTLQTALVYTLNNVAAFEGFIGATIYILFAFLYCLVFLKGKPQSKLMVCCIVEIVISLTCILVITVFSLISRQEFINLITEKEIWRFIAVIITKALEMFIVIIVLNIKKRKELSLTKNEWVVILTVFFCSLFIVLTITDIALTTQFSTINGVLFVAIILCLILINTVVIIMTAKIAKSNEERLRIDLLNLELQQQEKSILDVNDKYNTIIKIRHDIKNCVQCATALINQQHYSEAIDYLTKLSKERLPSVRQYIVTDSKVVNAVINSKLTICEEKHIDVKCFITSSFSSFEEIDLSIVFANLLDNAIEASENIKTPFIDISVNDKRGYLGIKVSNRIESSILENNPKLKTSKKVKADHGLGILSVKDVVKKNHGMTEFYEEHDMFICSLMLAYQK